MQCDVIVIGSGAGGLTAAVALARAGQRVLVLEQHYLPGGWTHSFTLGGYRFSPGVHYIGGLGEGGHVRRLFEGLGLSGALEFCELNPDGYDHYFVGGERFDVPKGEQRYRAALIARFPHERTGIEHYFASTEAISRGLEGFESGLSFGTLLTLPFKAPALVRYGLRPFASLLDAHIHDPLLRAILSAQLGNAGLSARRTSCPLYASMTRHYFEGAYYPRGGAKSIPQAMIKVLQQQGGRIRVRTRVRRILVEGNRATGVELEGGEVVRARHVISNADPATTFGELLDGTDGARERKRVRRMQYSVGSISLFCAVDMDLRALGYDSGNYWYYRHTDLDSIYERAERELPDVVDGLFLAITTLKDPGHPCVAGHHSLEMFTFVPYAPFAQWAGTSVEARPPAYEALKRSLADKVLATAEEVVPGVRRHLRFLAIGTPLTNDYYCQTHQGAVYGTAKTPLQMGPFSIGAKCSIDGLYLCGQSTLSHGFASAAYSGLTAAKHVLGVRRIEDLLGATETPLRVYAAESASRARTPRHPELRRVERYPGSV
jgi:phytoene dehydrogenase-like protein